MIDKAFFEIRGRRRAAEPVQHPDYEGVFLINGFIVEEDDGEQVIKIENPEELIVAIGRALSPAEERRPERPVLVQWVRHHPG